MAGDFPMPQFQYHTCPNCLPAPTLPTAETWFSLTCHGCARQFPYRVDLFNVGEPFPQACNACVRQGQERTEEEKKEQPFTLSTEVP